MRGLLEICEREDIHISYQPLMPDKLLGMFFRDEQCQPIIVLDKQLQERPRLERSVLAEEVGHYFAANTSDFNVIHFSYSISLELSRDEFRALRWATEYLMPTHRFLELVWAGAKTVDELADHFNVTTWMVWRKLHFINLSVPDEVCAVRD